TDLGTVGPEHGDGGPERVSLGPLVNQGNQAVAVRHEDDALDLGAVEHLVADHTGDRGAGRDVAALEIGRVGGGAGEVGRDGNEPVGIDDVEGARVDGDRIRAGVLYRDGDEDVVVPTLRR